MTAVLQQTLTSASLVPIFCKRENLKAATNISRWQHTIQTQYRPKIRSFAAGVRYNRKMQSLNKKHINNMS